MDALTEMTKGLLGAQKARQEASKNKAKQGNPPPPHQWSGFIPIVHRRSKVGKPSDVPTGEGLNTASMATRGMSHPVDNQKVPLK